MGPPLLKIHHPLDDVCPRAKVARRGGPIFHRVYIKTLWNRMGPPIYRPTTHRPGRSRRPHRHTCQPWGGKVRTTSGTTTTDRPEDHKQGRKRQGTGRHKPHNHHHRHQTHRNHHQKTTTNQPRRGLYDIEEGVEPEQDTETPTPQNPQPPPRPPPTPPPNYNRHLCPTCHVMVKLTDGTRTCSCKIQARRQGLGADYGNERLYLLD